MTRFVLNIGAATVGSSLIGAAGTLLANWCLEKISDTDLIAGRGLKLSRSLRMKLRILIRFPAA